MRADSTASFCRRRDRLERSHSANCCTRPDTSIQRVGPPCHLQAWPMCRPPLPAWTNCRSTLKQSGNCGLLLLACPRRPCGISAAHRAGARDPGAEGALDSQCLQEPVPCHLHPPCGCSFHRGACAIFFRRHLPSAGVRSAASQSSRRGARARVAGLPLHPRSGKGGVRRRSHQAAAARIRLGRGLLPQHQPALDPGNGYLRTSGEETRKNAAPFPGPWTSAYRACAASSACATRLQAIWGQGYQLSGMPEHPATIRAGAVF